MTRLRLFADRGGRALTACAVWPFFHESHAKNLGENRLDFHPMPVEGGGATHVRAVAVARAFAKIVVGLEMQPVTCRNIEKYTQARRHCGAYGSFAAQKMTHSDRCDAQFLAQPISSDS